MVIGRSAARCSLFPEKVDEAVACNGATASEDEIGGLAGVSNTQESKSGRLKDFSDEVQAYSFTCSLRSSEGRVVGSCPF